jgi:4-alpha-glucanotransferase
VAGVLLHPTSLPGPNGIGELGEHAIRFADALADMGVRLWQVLPLGPTGFGDSPYQCFSAYAGNPLLIPLDDEDRAARDDTVDFDRVIPHKRAALARAIAGFVPTEDYHAFVEAEADWLDDYALFMALKDAHHGAEWTRWPSEVAHREPAALVEWRRRLAPQVAERRVEQYLFHRHAQRWRDACAARGIALMGDVPIYVAHDSADVWAHRELFQLHDDGRRRVQAGVPPDYFSATGQLWGNPLYDWDRLRATGYAWWIRRMRAALARFDVVRIDHFRGFESYWEVPGDASTAEHGRWVKGPGLALFQAMAAALGPLPIVAENLGLITPAVETLRAACGFPGMAVLQFAFGGDDDDPPPRPHDFTRDLVVYTGTHDNDTSAGWWAASAEVPADGAPTPADPGMSRTASPPSSTQAAHAARDERAFARRYLGDSREEGHWLLIRAALASVANTAIVPLQDLLGLGSEARMNVPGRADGNWRWRFRWEQLTPEITARMRDLVTLYGRARRPAPPDATAAATQS